MADDKGGGGGAWGSFEIIVAILLAIGLLMRLQDTTSSTTKTTPVKKTSTSVGIATDPNSMCGLSLVQPRSLEKVDTSVRLVGMTEGCDWQSTPDVALYAQVIDAKGAILSPYTTVQGYVDDTNKTSFDTTIYLTAIPTTKTGYMILVSARNDTAHTVTTRVPLTFTL